MIPHPPRFGGREEGVPRGPGVIYTRGARPNRYYQNVASLLDDELLPPSREPLEEGAVLLRAFAGAEAGALVEAVECVARAAPFRHLVTPGGYTMSVAMTNCGRVGWVSDRTGYRYDPLDPDTKAPWPAMPP